MNSRTVLKLSALAAAGALSACGSSIGTSDVRQHPVEVSQSVESATPGDEFTDRNEATAGSETTEGNEAWVEGGAYMPPLDVEDWLASAPTVVVGTIQAVGDPMYTREATDGVERPFEAVFSLVAVDLDVVVRGNYEVGQQLELRFLGGAADGFEFHFEGAPDSARVGPGTRIVVIADDVGGEAILTPTIVLADDGTGFTEISNLTTDGSEPRSEEDIIRQATS